MKQLTLNGKNYLFVPVPDDARLFVITPTKGNLVYGYLHKVITVEIERPNAIFITTTTDITEEQAAKMVKKHVFISYLYRNYDHAGVSWANSSIDSFASLLRANQITGRHAIIQIL